MNACRLVLVLMVTAAFGSLAWADCIVRHRAIAINPPVIAIAPTAVAIPAYGASFDDTAALRNQVADLQKRLAAVEARLAVVEVANKPNPGPLPPAPKPNAAAPVMPKADEPAPKAIPAVYFRSCIQCHSDNGKPKGGLALVSADGLRVQPLTADQKLEVLRRINLKSEDKQVMPPVKSGHAAVTDEENAELLDLLTRK